MWIKMLSKMTEEELEKKHPDIAKLYNEANT